MGLRLHFEEGRKKVTGAVYPIKLGKRGSLVIMFREADRFLSNFWPCDVVLPAETVSIDGQLIHLPETPCSSTEIGYMMWKTVDLAVREKIQRMEPGEAKNFSHQEGFPLRPDYSDEGRIGIVYALNLQKFGPRNLDLLKMLLGTDDATLIEGTTWGDTFFGVDLQAGWGHNYLGRIQMDIRQRRRRELSGEGDSSAFFDYGLPLSCSSLVF